MFSGKSDDMIKRAKRLRSVGITLISVKPHRDVRDAHVTSRSGNAIPCFKIRNLCDVVTVPGFDEAEWVFVDEAQFFMDDVVEGVELMLDLGKKVYIYGLDGTAEQKPPWKLLDVIPLCDTVRKITALCQYCKGRRAAPFTVCDQALPESGVLIGSDQYTAVCRSCLNERRRAALA